ncbi:ATP synthase subunit alpha [bacterium HR34]|nr:ATP synthase subunit alpha [bacterium HR34]
MVDVILEELKKRILEIKREITEEKIGRVISVQDGVATVYGLSDLAMEEMVVINDKEYGIVLNLSEEEAGVLILGDYKNVKEGNIVKGTKKILEIPVSEKLIGRVVDPLIRPVDGLGDVFSNEKDYTLMNLNPTPPGVIQREPVDTPLFTGITAIDSMIPIGRGQRELIIGDRQTGKTQLCLDAIYAQRFESEEKRPICIYVSIGQKEAKVKRVVQELKDKGCMDYTIVVATSSSDPASLLWLAPLAGASIGEYFMKKGKDVLVIYDDLTKHAYAYREISLLLRRPPGREAYPGDIFYLHSRLLERAAKLKKEFGGGTMTALPIIETQLGDISGYIPTNVISITDGQIFLETDLFNQGVRPAINVGLSVSRVGSKAQYKAVKAVSGALRLNLATFKELEKFLQFGQELDPETQKKIETGKRIVEVLKQSEYEVKDVLQETILIFTSANGLLDDIPVEKVRDFTSKFIDYFKSNYKEVSEFILKEKVFGDKEKEAVLKAIQEFKKVYQ